MITLIFGAGASVPFFNPVLNTQYLTDRVSSMDEWTRIISKYKEKKGEGYSIVDPDEVIDVVDYYKDVLTMTNEYKDDNNIILRIHLCFGTDWGVLVDGNGNKKPMNPEGVNSANQKGYGWIFDQVLFYKKGYAAFLDEYENVLQYKNETSFS